METLKHIATCKDGKKMDLKHIIKKCELLIFDLDGTLYEGTDHFDYFAKCLQQKLSKEQQEPFMREYEEMKCGEHVAAIGKGYDINRDCLLSIDPLTLKVVAVEEWDGQRWSPKKIEEVYKDPISFDFERIIAIGDGWWLPFVIGTHYCIDNINESYNETKEYMVTDEFHLEKIIGLKEWLVSLKQDKQIVLMTNSDQDDVGRLLHELDLQNVFDHVITSAKKPTETKRLYHELMEHYKVKAEQVVSIGDNFLNEIAPALLMGMCGVYIQPNEQQIEHENLIIIKRITECYKH
ncbi:HAD family hydrolase [Anaerobacillus sp. MEB173]|uniref:HAD family hydrolase n=1 Tax=Anaerobacillus sp. MEB173 TaxID=3383345 RepID=UPI003F8E3819